MNLYCNECDKMFTNQNKIKCEVCEKYICENCEDEHEVKCNAFRCYCCGFERYSRRIRTIYCDVCGERGCSKCVKMCEECCCDCCCDCYKILHEHTLCLNCYNMLYEDEININV